jgi:hypothetical protein
MAIRLGAIPKMCIMGKKNNTRHFVQNARQVLMLMLSKHSSKYTTSLVRGFYELWKSTYNGFLCEHKLKWWIYSYNSLSLSLSLSTLESLSNLLLWKLIIMIHDLRTKSSLQQNFIQVLLKLCSGPGQQVSYLSILKLPEIRTQSKFDTKLREECVLWSKHTNNCCKISTGSSSQMGVCSSWVH